MGSRLLLSVFLFLCLVGADARGSDRLPKVHDHFELWASLGARYDGTLKDRTVHDQVEIRVPGRLYVRVEWTVADQKFRLEFIDQNQRVHGPEGGVEGEGGLLLLDVGHLQPDLYQSVLTALVPALTRPRPTPYTLRFEFTPDDPDGLDQETRDRATRVPLDGRIDGEVSWAQGDQHDWWLLELDAPTVVSVSAPRGYAQVLLEDWSRRRRPIGAAGALVPAGKHWIVVEGVPRKPGTDYSLLVTLAEGPSKPSTCDGGTPRLGSGRTPVAVGGSGPAAACWTLALAESGTVVLDVTNDPGYTTMLEQADGARVDLGVAPWRGVLPAGEHRIRVDASSDAAARGFVEATVCPGVIDLQGRVTGGDPMAEPDAFLLNLGTSERLSQGARGLLADEREFEVLETQTFRSRARVLSGAAPKPGAGLRVATGRCD